jgi:polyhydroxyalkanoate synthesis regulator protein
LAQFPYLLTVITLVDFRVMNTEQRLTDLETALAEYIRYNTQAQQRFEAESKQFREEMLAFKETLERDTQAFKAAIERDTQAFKEEIRRDTQAFRETLERDTQAFKEEIRRDTKALKAEMRTFKEEIRRDTEAFKAAMQALTERLENDLKESKRQMENELKESKRQLENELRESKRQWNKQWGELSNKLGTIVEDIIFPASRPVIESVFRVKVQQLATRVFRQQGNLRAEFDVVAVSERQVFLIDVKSTPRFDYLTDFVDNRIPVFRQLFPEYASLDLVPIFASLSIPDDIVKAATNRRVFAMAYREWEYMDILNAKELLPNL